MPLIRPANDRSPMGSDASRSVGTVGATNRTVVPITVVVRVWLANSHSPIGADASRSVDSIGTSGCLAWLGEHQRAERNHDGEHRYATSTEALRSAFHFWVPFGFEECEVIPSLAGGQIEMDVMSLADFDHQ